MRTDPIAVGICISCNYALRDLPDARCPECGRAIDPTDTTTMNMGSPMGATPRLFLRPVGAPTWRAHAVAVVAILWGWAWLPGGLFVAAAGGLGLSAIYAYRLVRLVLHQFVVWRYRQSRAQFRPFVGRRFLPAGMLLLLGVCIALDLPLRGTLYLTSWVAGDYLWRMYAVDPMPKGPLGPRFVGPLYASSVSVTPHGVHINVAGAGHVRYAPEEAASPNYFGVGPFRLGSDAWPPFTIAHLLTLMIAALFAWITRLGTRARRSGA